MWRGSFIFSSTPWIFPRRAIPLSSPSLADRRFARKRLRAREVVSGRRAGKMPHAQRHGKRRQRRDPKELERVWAGWHSIAPPMRAKYSRMVVLANKGARELGFANVGEM